MCKWDVPLSSDVLLHVILARDCIGQSGQARLALGWTLTWSVLLIE